MENRLKKRLVRFLLVWAVIAVVLTGQVTPLDGTAIVAEAAPAKSLKMNKTSLKLTKGKSYTLKVANAGRKKVKWSSKKKKVATVNSKGRVTAKGKGTTYIYAKVGGKTLRCKVTVSVPAPKLNKSSVTLNRGKSYTLKVSNASSKVRWSVKNKKVATVTSKGKVTARGKGTTYVYAKVGKKTLKCKVTVKESAVVRKYTIDSGKSKSLTFSGASSKTKWKSSNSSIVSVSKSKGKKVTVKARKVGKATITATTSGRKTYQFVITVKGKPETLPSKPSTPQTEAPQTETNPPVETEKPLPPQTETNPPQTETNPPQTETNPPQPETPKPPVETEKPKRDSNYYWDAYFELYEGDINNLKIGDWGRYIVKMVHNEPEAWNFGMIYSSSNSSVASIDTSGNVKVCGYGTAVLTVKGDDGVTIGKFTVTVTKEEEKPENFMEVADGYGALVVPYTDMVRVAIRTTVPIDAISYNASGVNSKIPEITFWEIVDISSSIKEFRFRSWIAGTYNITFNAPNVDPLTVPVTVTSSDPDWKNYNNWLCARLDNEWKADTPLNTFLKMGAWLADNRDYDASNTQFQKFYYMGGDCRAAEMLFIDVATRVFGLKAYSSNTTGGGHAKAVVEIGSEKWMFDAGFAGSAGVRPFTAVEINRKEQWKYSTEMTANGEVRGWTHRVP